ncbi:unnamed protein product [Ambrosiozyma monospora]|uniref:Unnamed protein product n=1 Tax=Ambrosiozyma monospora TaxID=43982 RepID=A0A9W6YS08_AMBMO|nr:unnamed protein product [Ambrosiozyma monospora]
MSFKPMGNGAYAFMHDSDDSEDEEMIRNAIAREMAEQRGGFYDANENYSVVANNDSDSGNDSDDWEEMAKHNECVDRLGFDLEYPELLPYVLEAQNDAIRWGKEKQRETNLKREQEAKEREQQNQQNQQNQQQQQRAHPILKSYGPGAFGLYHSSDDEEDDRAIREAIGRYAATLDSDSDSDSNPDGFGGYYLKAQNEAIAMSKKWQREANEKRQKEQKEREEKERRQNEHQRQQQESKPIFESFATGVFGSNHSSDDETDDRVLKNFLVHTFNPPTSPNQISTTFNTPQSTQGNPTFNFGSNDLPVLDIANLPTANQSSVDAAGTPTTVTPGNGNRARNNRRHRRGYRARGARH